MKRAVIAGGRAPMSKRFPEVETALQKHTENLKAQGIECALCDMLERHNSYSLPSNTYVFLRNEFPYTEFDGREVLEHWLLLPTEHTAQEALPAKTLPDYDVWIKSPNERSVRDHFHAHLFKLGNHV